MGGERERGRGATETERGLFVLLQEQSDLQCEKHRAFKSQGWAGGGCADCSTLAGAGEGGAVLGHSSPLRPGSVTTPTQPNVVNKVSSWMRQTAEDQ